MPIQRQGNCTKRSFGNSSQRSMLGRIIKTAAAPLSRSIASHNALALRSSGFSSLRFAKSAAIAVITISNTAMLDAIQLNWLCSGSAMLV